MEDINDRLVKLNVHCTLRVLEQDESVIVDAIKTIVHLREALRRIGYDYVELSWDKVNNEYLKHIHNARKAYHASFPQESDFEPKPTKELDDDF